MSHKPHQHISVRLFIALAFFTLFTEHGATAQTVQATIPVQPVDILNYTDGRGAIAVNPTTNRIYVHGYSDNQHLIKVIDATDNSSIAMIPLGNMSNGSLAINPQTNRIYVTGIDGSFLKVIDGNANSVIATVDLYNQGGRLLRGPVVDTAANKIYVWSYGDINSVFVIDGNANSVTATIPVTGDMPAGTCPCDFEGSFLADNGMAVNSATHRVYMPLRDYLLLIIDGASNSATTMPLDFQASGEIVVNPNANRIYIAGQRDPDSVIGVIDGATNTLVDHIPLPAGYDILNVWDNGYSAMGINTTTNRIYKYGYEGPGQSIATIDGNGNTVLSRSPISSSTLSLLLVYIAVNPKNGLIYSGGADASNNPVIAIIDPRATQLTTTGSITTQADAATLTFDNVTSPGTVSVTPIADPAAAGDVPGGFAISQIAAYEITKDTSLQFTGPVTTCFSVPTVTDAVTFATLRVLHRELNTTTGQYELVDRTTSSDFTTRTICATTTSFSPFYFARIGNNVRPLFDRSRAYRAGSTIPIKVQLLNASGANVSTAATQLMTRGLRMIGGNTTSAVNDSGNANPDSNFRYDSSLGGYIFNLSTRGLAAGRYVLSFYAGSERGFFYTVAFEVK